MINLTIDNTPVTIKESSTVLQAAREAGIKIPTLCDHPELKPYGGCRLCLVEVEGARTLQTSCTLPVTQNMVVRTNTAKVLDARRFVLTLIFSERNHFCMYCQVSGGDCELQNAALELDMTHWPLSPNYQPYAMDASHPYFVLDNNRCILCHRCVRACGELVGNYTLGVEERGAKTFLVADMGSPLGESTCISCGVCVQVCPTGALIDRVSAYRGKELQVEHHQTVCVGCSVGCGIDVLTRDNHLVRIEGLWDSTVSGGLTCEVGRFTPLEEQKDRILQPYIRKNGALRAATWEEALDVAVAHLKPAIGKNKGGVSALISSRQPAENMALFKQIFSNGMKSDYVTSVEEDKTTAIASGLAAELGKSFEGSFEDIQTADCVIVVGANLVENHQVAGFFVKRNVQGGTKLIVVDPNENKLDALADIIIRAKKTSDVDIVASLQQIVDSQKAKKSNVEQIAAKTGLDLSALQQFAQITESAKHPVIIYGRGVTAQGSTALLKALVNLAESMNGKVIGLKGKANSLSAAQLGLDKPFTVDGNSVLYLVMGDDEPSQRLIKSLEDAPFTIVQASYYSKVTAKADVVLPSTTWLEEGGTYINLDGHMQQAISTLLPPPDVKTNGTILETIQNQLGFEGKLDTKAQLLSSVSPVEIRAA